MISCCLVSHWSNLLCYLLHLWCLCLCRLCVWICSRTICSVGWSAKLYWRPKSYLFSDKTLHSKFLKRLRKQLTRQRIYHSLKQIIPHPNIILTSNEKQGSIWHQISAKGLIEDLLEPNVEIMIGDTKGVYQEGQVIHVYILECPQTLLSSENTHTGNIIPNSLMNIHPQ